MKPKLGLFFLLVLLLFVVVAADAKILGGTAPGAYELDHVVIQRAVRIELCPTDKIDETGFKRYPLGDVPNIRALPCGTQREDAVIGRVSVFLRNKDAPPSPPPSDEAPEFLVLFKGQLYRECGASFGYYPEGTAKVFWDVITGHFKRVPNLKFIYSDGICRVDPRLPLGQEKLRQGASAASTKVV